MKQLALIVLALLLTLPSSLFLAGQDSRTVYVTSDGTLYHLQSCPSLKGHQAHPVPLGALDKNKYHPCFVCHPDGSPDPTPTRVETPGRTPAGVAKKNTTPPVATRWVKTDAAATAVGEAARRLQSDAFVVALKALAQEAAAAMGGEPMTEAEKQAGGYYYVTATCYKNAGECCWPDQSPPKQTNWEKYDALCAHYATNASRAARGQTLLPDLSPDELRTQLTELTTGGSTGSSPTPSAMTFASKNWSGNGAKQTESFDVPVREWKVRWSNTGDGNFAVHVFNDQDEQVELIGNIIGSGHDVSFVHAPPGRFYLKITGDNWSVSVEP